MSKKRIQAAEDGQDSQTLRQEVGLLLGRELATRSALFNQAIADQLGINVTDLRCIDLLNRHDGDPMTAGQLAAATRLTSGSVTDLLDRLERVGLIERRRSSRDRRVVQVVLREREHAKVARLYQGLAKGMRALVASYSDEELRIIHDFFSRAIALSQVETTKLRQRTPRRR